MDELTRYYDGYDEDSRLVKDNSHRVEFLTTAHYLEKVLAPRSTVLDVGAGTGRYAFCLAERGHRVTARDIVPRHVEIMRARAAEVGAAVDVGWGDARNLSEFEAERFDAVLCMGPLYHLEAEAERRAVIGQCLRVLCHGGVLAAAYINRHASFLAELLRGVRPLTGEAVDEVTGARRATARGCFYSSHPAEVEALISAFGVEPVAHVAADGAGYLLGEWINGLGEERFAQWMRYHLRTCEEPSLLGYSLHGLYLGRKR